MEEIISKLKADLPSNFFDDLQKMLGLDSRFYRNFGLFQVLAILATLRAGLSAFGQLHALKDLAGAGLQGACWAFQGRHRIDSRQPQASATG